MEREIDKNPVDLRICAKDAMIYDAKHCVHTAKKELAKAQPWRVDEWREFKFFERALRRYLRTDHGRFTALPRRPIPAGA